MHWRAVPERGTVFGIRLLVALLRLVGRPATGALLWVVCWYFVATSATARRASRQLGVRLGERRSVRRIHRHVWTFARVALDRALFLAGETGALELDLHGHELVMSLSQRGRGALLLGAHLGSFEAMRALAGRYSVPMLVVVDFHNAAQVTAALAALRDGGVRLLNFRPDDPFAVLQVKDAIERGELVAVLGDRATHGARDVVTPFLGAPARFPAGPMVLASVLACPVFFVCALFIAPATYRVYCQPLCERVELPRVARAAALEAHVARYARALEHFTRLAPDNWFNFFPFWGAA